MINDLFETFCKTIISQFKIPRKGVVLMLFILSSFAIVINKWVFHYSIASKGSILLQIIYLSWMYSVFAFLAKAYNEYCDKKDAENAKLEEQQKYEEKIDKYFKIFSYCDNQETNILEKFYYNQKTSINVDDVSIIRAMHNKGIKFMSYEGIFQNSVKAIISTNGLNLINKYFDKQKPQFFELLQKLEEKEIKLMQDFIYNNNEQISLYKKEVKIAKSIINKFQETQFDDIYIDSEGFFTISTLYLAYLDQYFSDKLK